MKNNHSPFPAVFLFVLLMSSKAFSQEFKETTEALSKKAIKGYVNDFVIDDTGNSRITYKVKGEKKSDAILFEEYTFDKNLKFQGTADIQEKKDDMVDYERTQFYAFVGGTTSFDVLSMKLKFKKSLELRSWNYDKQYYFTQKTLKDEVIKPKNDAGKVYLGYASYTSIDEKKTDVFVIAKVESKEKNQQDNFVALLFDQNEEIQEKPLEMKGNYSLVFSEQLLNDDIVAVFAPVKGSADISNYLFFQFGIEGNIKSQTEFQSPASALLITAAYQQDGEVFFFGSSTKSKDSFEKVFNEYAPIFNPGVTEGGANKLDLKWRKSLDEEMEYFHLLKFSEGKNILASTTPISEFKSKFKTAPGDKGANPYKGKRFLVGNFFVTPSQDYVIAGQLTSSVSMGMGDKTNSYEDLVCFHFDKSGALKAQYGVSKLNGDKKSEIFSMPQNFYLSPDGKSLYWEILEVKGVKGFESFLEAYYDVPSFYPLYFPRIGKIDLSNSTVGTFKSLGGGKYFLKRNFSNIRDETQNSITYVGHDEDYKNLWLGKMTMD